MIKSPPLDVANLTSILKKATRYDVKVFDLRIDTIKNNSFWKKKGIDVDIFNNFRQCLDHVSGKEQPKIAYVSKKILGETNLTNIQYLLFSVSVLEQFSLQYLTSSLCTAYHIKKIDPSKKIIFFGNCPRNHIRKIMVNFSFLDAFLEDGNEFSVLEYLNKNEKITPIKGVIYREKNRINYPVSSLTLKIDTYPIPDFSLFNLDKYKSNGALILPYEISRGCINKCFFCYYIYKGGKVYKKGYKKAVIQLIQLKNKYKTNKFHFIDAEINFDNDYLTKFCKELLKKEARILWSALAIPYNLNPELLGLMRKAGCVQLRFGVESGSPRLLRTINKNTTITEISQVLKDSHNVGIYTYITLINGLPMEEWTDVLATKYFLRKNNTNINSATICNYGELGHFGIQMLDKMLHKPNIIEKSERIIEFTKNNLEMCLKKSNVKNNEDIIDDFFNTI